MADKLVLAIPLIALLAMTSASISQGHIVRSGDCSVDPPPHLAGKPVTLPPDFDFRWESSASSKQGSDGKWCYDRYVLNNHQKNPLRFDWPTAGMGSKEGLPSASQKPLNLLHVNFLWESGPPQPRDGFLTYGVGQRPEPTRVYLTPEEAVKSTSGKSTTASLFIGALDESGRPLRIDVTLRATFDERRQMTYVFVSRSDDPVLADFQPTRMRDFYNDAVKKLRQPWDFGKPMPLQEGSLSVSFRSEKGVFLAIAPIRFFSAKGTEIAYVSVPTIVPIR